MKKVVVLIDDADEFLEHYRDLAVLREVAQGADVHYLNVFEKTYYNNEFSEYSWPPAEKFPEIVQKMEQKLARLNDRIDLGAEKVEFHCLVESGAADVVIDFLRGQKADLCVVATRGIQGILSVFVSSMAEHLLKFSPCPVLALRPKG